MIKHLLAVLLLLNGLSVYSSDSGNFLNAPDGIAHLECAGSFTRQDSSWSREVDFIRYLIGRGDYRESLFLLERLVPQNAHQRDSLNYLTGWVHYQQKSLDLSAEFLLEVSKESPVYSKSRFFAAYNLAHVGHTGRAKEVLELTDEDPGKMHQALKRLQLGGIALLERDFEQYRSHAGMFSGNHHVTAAEENQMEHHYDQLRNHRSSSPLLAGMLSAAVPGLGKIYAGKTAEGVAGFLYVAALGLTAFDFYRGSGPDSVLFVLSASAAGAFYVGNIVGSVAAARRTNQEFNHELDQRILFDMHIPLRNAF
ncbi:MAG: hypothetical protein ACLFN2_00775 [Bacteroidales bacterium]